MSKARTDMNAEDKGLGQTIAAWFAANQWAQTFPEQWAKSYGVKGPHASQIAFLKQRKLEPRAGFFKGLGEFNRAVAERDLHQVSDERTKDLLIHGRALTREDGVPFGPMEFLGLYLGIVPIPDWLNNRDQQLLTLQSDIDVWAEGVRLMFSDACMGTFTNAQDYWLKVQKGMGESQDRTLCQQVILGLDKPSADDLVDGTALAGTRDLEELINNVFRENKGEDLDRVSSLRDVRQSIQEKVEALTA